MSRELHHELGGEMAALDKLGPAEQARLLELIRATRKRQSQNIRVAMEGALQFIPVLLRIPVRALFKR